MTEALYKDRFEGLYFDFDGVIVDSVPIKAHAFKKLFESYGKFVADKVYNDYFNTVGINRKEKITIYHREFLNQTLSESQLNRICERFSSIVVDAIANAPLIPGIEEYLIFVHKRMPIFVISSAPDTELKEIIRRHKLGQYFNEVLGSLTNKAVAIDMLNRKYSLDPQKCIFYGDAESDYKAAVASGVQFCAVIGRTGSSLLDKIPLVNRIKDFRELN